MAGKGRNIDYATVEGFGAEWGALDQSSLGGAEFDAFFRSYFDIFPFSELPPEAEGFDLGCGSGRWANRVAEEVGLLHCIDPSKQALDVARRNLAGHANVKFHCAAVDSIPLDDGSQDFGYSLGVLHHVPDTRAALSDCVRKLRPGAPFLLYLYYALDGRPAWFRALWRVSDTGRKGISRLSFRAKRAVTEFLAATVYWPLARSAKIAERMGADVSDFPLSSYRNASFYTMRTDALDRFGTRLEHRFTRGEIESMMMDAGLADIRFSEREPFWVACGRRGAE
jgi:ubiquinone/menaquinone biosynthesis C-methylase UbiE